MTEAAEAEQPQAAEEQPQNEPATTSADEVPEDPDQAEVEFKICKDIVAMPDPVKDRFKALKVLTDQLHALDQEEDIAYRAIERKYELRYAEVYLKRTALLKGDATPDPTVIEKYEELKTKMTDDPEYEALEVPICDVKDIQNTTKGVSGFFLRAMLAH